MHFPGSLRFHIHTYIVSQRCKEYLTSQMLAAVTELTKPVNVQQMITHQLNIIRTHKKEKYFNMPL